MLGLGLGLGSGLGLGLGVGVGVGFRLALARLGAGVRVGVCREEGRLGAVAREGTAAAVAVGRAARATADEGVVGLAAHAREALEPSGGEHEADLLRVGVVRVRVGVVRVRVGVVRVRVGVRRTSPTGTPSWSSTSLSSSEIASIPAHLDRSSVARASCRVALPARGPVMCRAKAASFSAYAPTAGSRYIVHTSERLSSNTIGLACAISRDDATLSPRFHTRRNLAPSGTTMPSRSTTSCTCTLKWYLNEPVPGRWWLSQAFGRIRLDMMAALANAVFSGASGGGKTERGPDLD